MNAARESAMVLSVATACDVLGVSPATYYRALCTPRDVHYGLVAETIAHRTTVLDAAFHAHPERFTRSRPTPTVPPNEVWINKPNTPEVTTDEAAQ